MCALEFLIYRKIHLRPETLTAFFTGYTKRKKVHKRKETSGLEELILVSKYLKKITR